METAIVCVSHVHEEVARLAEMSIVLENGRVSAVGPTADILRGSPWTRSANQRKRSAAHASRSIL